MKKAFLFVFSFFLIILQYVTVISPSINASYARDLQLEEAHSVFVAEYTGECVDYGVDKYLKLKPVKTFYGDVENDFCLIYLSDKYFKDIQYKENKVTFNFGGRNSYEKGKKYLIVAQKEVSVFYPYDKYHLIDKTFLPLDDFSMVYYAFDDTTISNKIIYKENTPESIVMYSNEEMCNNFIEYVISQIERSGKKETHLGYDFIRSEDFNTVMDESNLVLRIKTGKRTSNNKKFNFSTYNCKVVECVKGEFAENNVNIQFLYNSVKPHKEYVVCLMKDEISGDYLVTSKNAVEYVGKGNSSWIVVLLVPILTFVFLCFLLIKKNKTRIQKFPPQATNIDKGG